MPNTKNYDPIAATVFRIGLPDGDEFFVDNLDFMREVHGDLITDTLRAAYTENDLSKAEEFAALLVEDFAYEIVKNDDERLEIEYSAAGDVHGNMSLLKSGFREGDLLVQAVLKASEGIWSSVRVRAKVDAEIAAEEAAANVL
ncbi:hypothetical protein G6L37_05295 [Agrobacterium rubi]|nr:hypothetical protein [Agrobacterium rubi]NTF24772.1 hypothetical protein [Agrobacterium rubi]